MKRPYQFTPEEAQELADIRTAFEALDKDLRVYHMQANASLKLTNPAAHERLLHTQEKLKRLSARRHVIEGAEAARFLDRSTK